MYYDWMYNDWDNYCPAQHFSLKCALMLDDVRTLKTLGILTLYT